MKGFFVSAAHKEVAHSRGDEHASQGASRAPRARAFWSQLLGFVVLPLVLMGLCLWDLHEQDIPDSPLRADVRVAAAQTTGAAAGLAFMEVHIEPSVSRGGQEGLLVRGQVINSSTAPINVVPMIVAQASHVGLQEPIGAKLQVDASTKAVGANEGEVTADGPPRPSVLLQPGQKLPFVGIINVPKMATDSPWDVLVTWSQPPEGATQGSQAL